MCEYFIEKCVYMFFQHLGHTGVVNKLNLDETVLLLSFIVNGARFRVAPDALKKVGIAGHM